MISFFKRSASKLHGKNAVAITTDMHAHFLPGIDDGASDMTETLLLIQKLMESGYKKLIATPHIMSDFFKNTPEIILGKLAEVKEAVAQQGWQIEIEAAAEYYLDEFFIEKLKKEEPLLTFGDRYLLFETSFINQPAQLNEAIFLMQSLHYKPILAHPERYMYLQDNFAKCTELFQNGVLLQININSLSGYYSVPAQLLAERLIDLKMVHFAGTDCHAIKHIKGLQMAKAKKYYSKLLEAELLNHKI
jgi:protein-tyrosine phosphatase